MKTGFLGKLVERLDRLDPQNLQTHFLRLVQERGLLETIFQSIQEGILVIDRHGVMSYANRAAEQMLGFKLAELKDRSVSRYLRDIDWDRVLGLDAAEWARMISHEIEVRYPERRFLSFYVVPLAADANKEPGAVVILRDITRDRQNEATLLESERLNAIKLLAAGVAHEIGNPLNALNIHLQLVERELRELPQAERDSLGDLVRVARNEVTRLDLIIAQFLRAIRPGKPHLALARVDTILHESLALLKLEIENRKIDVRIDIPESIPRIRADRNQLKQAFFNIIRNAFQAMPDGGALAISLSVTDRFLILSFRDTGSGIQREDLGRIFDPYFTTKPGGSGLGLMIVQRIVQEHGGQIEVSSKPGEGTRIAILLPLAERRPRLLKAAAEREE